MGNYAINAITGKLDRVSDGGTGGGNVTGPDSSTDGNLVVFDGATGKIIQDTGISSTDPEFNTVSVNSFLLPQTSIVGTPVGFIYMDGNRYLHSAGNVSNIFLGSGAGNINNTSDGSTGIGQNALGSLTSGISNTALGHVAGDAISTGAMNTCIGEGAMFQSGGAVIGNTALGWHALIVCQGNYNVGVGHNVLGTGVTGQQNIGIGYFALSALLGGNFNTAIGPQAGTQYTGSESNNLCLNHLGVTGESNTTRIGNSASTNCFIYGIEGQLISQEQTIVIDPNTNQVGVLTGKPAIVMQTDAFSIQGGGTHVLFTTDRDFILEQIYSVTVGQTGAAGDSQSSIGYNGPTYDNILTGITFPALDNQYTSASLNSGNYTIIPSGSTIVLNVNTPDSTSTAYDVKVYLTGFYV